MKKIKAVHSDLQPDVWFDRWLPEYSVPYTRLARFDRPIGAWLLFIPGLWSIGLAGSWSAGKDVLSLAWITLLFLAGAIVMRGAGCVINDLWDRDLDARVERTSQRPLASGALKRQHAIFFLLGLLSIGLGIVLLMPLITLSLAGISLILVVVYPLAKRVTYWPQAVLGLTFNFGALMGASAVLSELPAFVWPLYAGCFFWTIGYDTIYAHQDREDDLMVGIKSTALLFGEHTTSVLRGVYALAVCSWGIALLLSSAGVSAWLGFVVACTIMVVQIRRLNIHDPACCLSLFKLTAVTGWLFGFGIFLDIILG